LFNYKYSRCEAALGYKLYSKAYEYLKLNKDGESNIIREHLISKIY